MPFDPSEQRVVKKRPFMSAREWHNNTMFDRREGDSDWHWLWGKGALAEQYTIGVSIQIEQHEMEHVREHQEGLRAILPRELIEAMQRGVPEGHTLGRVFFAPKTWMGSRRHMQQAYGDAQAIFTEARRPTPILNLDWQSELA